MKSILFLAMLLSTSAFSACQINPGGDYSMTFGNVIAQRDAPVGSTLSHINPSMPGYSSGDGTECDLYGSMVYMGPLKSSIDDVYQTNIPGVGIKFSAGTNEGGGDLTPYPGTFMGSYTDGSYGIFYIDAYLIKTDTTSSGALTPGEVAELTLNHKGETNGPVVRYNLISSSVTTVACAITTPKLTFPLGDVKASEFGTTIGFVPNETSTQNLGLDCDAEANINVELSGTQNPDVSEQSVLALSEQGDSGVASGLGVQLIYAGTPLEINKRIVMKKSEGGQEMLPITAQYYQTKTSVMPGDASTSATLTLTYQ